MVDAYGRWYEEEDYSTYPKEKWCDMDRVANYIREQGYTPKTSMENLIENIIAYFESEVEEDDMFSPAYGEDLNIHVPYLSAFVVASGGFREFDFKV